MAVRSALIVDDDPVLRELFSVVLENDGLTGAEFAGDGNEAQERLAANPEIGFVTLDLNMPSCDGIGFLRHASRLGYRGKIILISGEPPEIRESAARLAHMLGLNCVAILGKPVDFQQVTKLLAVPEPEAKRTERSPIDLKAVRVALDKGRMHAAYQPRLDIQCNRLAGAEALARIRDAAGNLLNTEVAIGLAEEHGLISEITWKMVDLICRDLMEFKREMEPGFRLSFNISNAVLGDDSFVERLIERIHSFGHSPQSFILEITETALPSDKSIALEQLTRARLNRFGIAVDDFGTGQSNIAQMRQYPFTELKIDKSFLLAAERDRFARAAIEAGAALGREQGLLVVAEGVETLNGLEIARNAGVNEGQGYLFAKPLPAQEFILRAREIQSGEAAFLTESVA